LKNKGFGSLQPRQTSKQNKQNKQNKYKNEKNSTYPKLRHFFNEL
jgi:hypothetical protein